MFCDFCVHRSPLTQTLDIPCTHTPHLSPGSLPSDCRAARHRASSRLSQTGNALAVYFTTTWCTVTPPPLLLYKKKLTNASLRPSPIETCSNPLYQEVHTIPTRHNSKLYTKQKPLCPHHSSGGSNYTPLSIFLTLTPSAQNTQK